MDDITEAQRIRDYSAQLEARPGWEFGLYFQSKWKNCQRNKKISRLYVTIEKTMQAVVQGTGLRRAKWTIEVILWLDNSLGVPFAIFQGLKVNRVWC